MVIKMLIDSHAHYYDERFSGEYEGGADALLSRLFSSGDIDCIINVGADIKSSRECIAQAGRYENMYAAAGIHPSDTRFCADMDSDMSELAES